MEWLIPLLSLISLEVILGIDNIIFISILADKLHENQRNKLRFWGIAMAMLMRLGLLALISWILKLDKTIFTLFEVDFSGKGLILILGGLFLIYKSVKEIYYKTEISKDDEPLIPNKASFKRLLTEVIILDLVFSIDSIITAVGMVQELWVMYTAVIVTVIIMLFASKPISEFIRKHPSFKILALCFLMMIGVSLLAEGFQFEIPKGYIYFSMAFAFLVDIVQMKTVKISKMELLPVDLIQINNSKISEIDNVIKAIYRLIIYSRYHSDDDLLDIYLEGVNNLKEQLSIKNAQMEAQNEEEAKEYLKNLRTTLDFVIGEITNHNNFEKEIQLFQLLRLASPETHAIHPNRYRRTLVQIGSYICPEPAKVPQLVSELFTG